jgi:S-adenosylmethionine synthetase
MLRRLKKMSKIDPGNSKLRGKNLFKGDHLSRIPPVSRCDGLTGYRLAGRKTIADTYGGEEARRRCVSGKMSRSTVSCYATAYCKIWYAGIADEVLTRAYIMAKPVGVYVNTFGTSKVNMEDGEIAKKIEQLFDLRPAMIIRRLGLKNPIFLATAAYGHMGRNPYTAKVALMRNGTPEEKDVEFFAWEKLDYVPVIKKEFGL